MKYKKENDSSYVDPKLLVDLENQLQDIKEEHGIQTKSKLWVRIGDFLVKLFGSRTPIALNRKKYIKLALFTGLFGGHRFYAKQYFLGTLYLLTCWTGFSIAMTMIDLMTVLPKQANENGIIDV